MASFRPLLALAILALVAAATPAMADSALTPAQEEAVRRTVTELLKSNPEIVVDALKSYQEKQEAAQRDHEKITIESLRNDLENDEASPVVGNPNGDVTIVEFMDYRCGYCKKVFPELQALLKEDPKIRYVFKEFPVLGEESVMAAHYALAVWAVAPNKYADYHAALMNNRGAFTEDKLLKIAEGYGIDGDALKRAVADEATEKAIKKIYAMASTLGIRGTPAFIVGGRLVPGAVGIAVLRQLVAEARKS